jgi:hypothetical protein
VRNVESDPSSMKIDILIKGKDSTILSFTPPEPFWFRVQGN